MNTPSKAVEQQLRELAQLVLSPHGLPLEDLIDRWRALVNEIGAYRGSIADEYLNDLGTRFHIARMLDIAHDHKFYALLASVLPVVDEIDHEFLRKSKPDIEGLVWGSYLEPSAWWLRRMPKDEGLEIHFRVLDGYMRAYEYQTTD